MKYVKHKDIDIDKWDHTVLSSSTPLVFAQSFYLNSTCPNWDALIIDDYKSIFPLTHKTKFGFNYLPQPPFTSQLGAFGIINKEIEEVFYNYIISHYKLIEIELNSSNKIMSDFCIPKCTYTIDYSKDYQYNQNTKRNISKAVKNNFNVEIVAFDEVLNLSKKLLNPFLFEELKLSKAVVDLFNKLLLNALNIGCLYTFKVFNDKNEIKALAHFISNNKHTLYLKGTNFDREDNSGSMHLLMDTAINYFKDKSDIFDFGGGSNSQGLANFYKGLAGSQLIYNFLRINSLPPLIKTFKNYY